uniref:C2H2-type domain-containing protein n=1 Tax=Astyanax mexicanus TaxID=7994 RepID=W5KIF3_ASTMX
MMQCGEKKNYVNVKVFVRITQLFSTVYGFARTLILKAIVVSSVSVSNGFSAMASVTDVGKFESLNFSIHERLTTVAGEIFQLVKETLSEFQEEVYRCRQENIQLKRRLAETSSTEPDVQLKHVDILVEDQNSSQGLVGAELDSETSAVQVKVEFSTQQAQQPLCHYSTPACNPEPSPVAPTELPHADFPAHVDDSTLHKSDGGHDGGHDEGVDVYMNSYVTVKLERCDSQLTGIDQQSYSSLVQNGSGSNHDYKRAVKDEAAAHWVQSSDEPGDALPPPPPQRMINSMTGEKMSLFHCKYCPETFEHAEQFKAHMQKHRKEAGFRCEFCGKCYSSNSAFQNHVRMHTGDKPYLCRFCNMTFSLKSSLEEHEKIRPYSCTKCGKHFIWLNQARLHVQNEHPENPDTIIKRSTKHGVLKVAHTGVGVNYCQLCGKNYSTRQVLRIHLRTHTGEKPYNCRFCNKRFTQKCHMIQHERIHTGENKYSCSVCGMSYRWLRSAKVHIQNHHSQGAEILRN